ncbi:hypothetical protein MKEN_00053300 [Mycena kentingensis (nom. inval.)]|nr:hypothetical protein MKEN_00053300 [Mycena kentingensis (nom. inval.)]
MGSGGYQDQGFGMGYGERDGYSPPYDDGYGGGHNQETWDPLAQNMDYGQQQPYNPFPGHSQFGQNHNHNQMHGQHMQRSSTPYQNQRFGHSFDDLNLGVREPYYDENNMQLQVARPVTPMGMQPAYSSHSIHRPRHRRHSTVSYSALPPTYIDPNVSSMGMGVGMGMGMTGTMPMVSAVGAMSTMASYRPPGGLQIKFKPKKSWFAGVNLIEAQSTRTKMSGNDLYSLSDLHANYNRRIYLRVQWAGYSALTYEVPVDTYDGRVDMQVLCRRVARACVHYLQANMVNARLSHVILNHLDETSYGVWTPMLSTR